MTSDEIYKEAFVWIWLAGETKPVVAGKLEVDNGNMLFNYGKSYLERIHDTPPSISIYEPELPLLSTFLSASTSRLSPPCSRTPLEIATGGRSGIRHVHHPSLQ